MCVFQWHPLSVLHSRNQSFAQSFRRLPTDLEWARFQRYSRKIRTFEEYQYRSLSLQVLLVLQSRAFSEPLLPNLKSLTLTDIPEKFVSFIPLFLSPRMTSIYLGSFEHDVSSAAVASAATTISILCPNLQSICLDLTQSDPMIAAAVSGILLAINGDTLQEFDVGSPLTEEAKKVICRLPNLCDLQIDIGGSNSLPTLALPNLTQIEIYYDHDHGWLQAFRGATLEKLTSITFHCRSHPTGDFLEAFESVALTTSIPMTLSEFVFCTSLSWKPNYRSLLPFTQLKGLIIDFVCNASQHDCPSAIDDDIITDLARALTKLETLQFGNRPCMVPTGVTTKGLVALACYCPHLSSLSIHFRVATLGLSKIPRATPRSQPTTHRKDCALTYLDVGSMHLPEESTLVVTQTLLRIFPYLCDIGYADQSWRKVANAFTISKRLVDRSSKKHSFTTPHSSIDIPPRSHTRERCSIVKYPQSLGHPALD